MIAEYLAATTPDERLKLCHLGSLKPAQFHQHYADSNFKPFRVTMFTSIDRLTYQVEAIRNDGMMLSARYYLTSTVDRLRLLIDWPRSVGLNDLTISAFQAKREQQPRAFWVTAELNEFYVAEFDDSRIYQSVWLNDTTKDGPDLYRGYLRRGDLTCKAFIEYLSRGEQPMTVLLSPNRELDDTISNTEMDPRIRLR